MIYRILADIIVSVHFLWILFMLAGFFLNIAAFWKKALFDLWVFRTAHLLGIMAVGFFAALGMYCPLTLWENALRAYYDPSLVYPGSFIIHYVEKLVYPGVHPLAVQIPTTFIAFFTAAVFIFRPPQKITQKLQRFFVSKG